MRTPKITTPRMPLPGPLQGAPPPMAPRIRGPEAIRGKRPPRPAAKKPLPRPPKIGR